MTNIAEYIQSGILESYVFGNTSAEETSKVEEMALTFEAVREKIDEISMKLENYAFENALQPAETVKVFLMATIDYTERLKNGEEPTAPPLLHEGSNVSDYAPWLDRADMVLPEDFDSFHAKIIGYRPGVTTAIVWIKEIAQQEVHDDEYEKFIVVEGTCLITIEENKYELQAGDFLSIPLYKNHSVKVTSDIPCKVILQRIAA
jgi:mannose-6-phosphate isomerase-like protein (cupin superfamily)